jgi:molybdopterin synthase sulfur carrier subunit
MNLTLKLYATLSDYLPVEAQKTNEVALTVVEDATVGALIEQCNLPKKLVHLVLLNGHFVPPAARGAHTLSEGDVLTIWPPVAGNAWLSARFGREEEK